MRNKWVIGGIVVVLAAVALVAGQMWMNRRVDSPGVGAGATSARPSAPGQRSAATSNPASASASTTATETVPEAPKTPAAAGAPLTLLASPPTATVGGFNADYLAPSSRFSVTVEPYGLGPQQGSSRSVVVRIVSAKGLDGAKGAEKLVGKNAFALIGPSRSDAFTKGGTVTAVLTLKPDPRGSVLVLDVTGATK